LNKKKTAKPKPAVKKTVAKKATAKKAVAAPKINELVKGKFVGTAKGFGFVVFEEKGADDIFIPPHFTCGALHGDEVEVQLTIDRPRSANASIRGRERSHDVEDEHKQLGRITQILRRDTYVGTYYTEGAQGYVRPLEGKIPYTFAVPPKSKTRFALADGHRIVFSVDKKSKPENELTSAFVTEVLGHMNDPGVDVLTLVRQAGIPYEWPEDVTAAANAMPTEVDESAKANRLDLRNDFICTIDGDDTKDIDDAISLTTTAEGGFKLGVHIADVTHYVTEGAPLDREALRRGTSVYLADRVIPMLPHSLSSGICSLFPNVDRLTLSCLMTVDKAGNVTDYEIRESLINSKRRWTYNDVEMLLETEQPPTAEDDEALTLWLPFFQNLDRLRAILWDKRRKRGALDFDLPEAKIRVNEEGRPISIEPYARNRATAIIEECMILCNETIATYALDKKIPFAFRTHEPPDAVKLSRLKQVAANYGVKIPATASKPKALQKVLATVAETPGAYAISGAVLRALPQALYTADNPSHYGLASDAYCHFTSPIRRYADLQIHRILKSDAPKSFKGALPVVCGQASRTERTAEALEREVSQLKKVQFMEDYIGETFGGMVSGITAWGVYVMLPSTIEGMVPIETLKKSGLRYDKDKKCYVSQRNKTALALGTKVTVRLVDADTEERKLTFKLVDK